jgi:hypothetical protein
LGRLVGFHIHSPIPHTGASRVPVPADAHSILVAISRETHKNEVMTIKNNIKTCLVDGKPRAWGLAEAVQHARHVLVELPGVVGYLMMVVVVVVGGGAEI